MVIRLENIRQFQTAIRAIANFISEGNFRFNDKGISFIAIDKSQIVLVNYNAPMKIFKEFNIEPTLIGLDISDLNKVMSRAFPNDVMELKISDSHLNIRFLGEFERNFRLSLIDIDEEETVIPKQRFEAKLIVKAKLLQEILKDAGLFATSAIFKVSNNSLMTEAKGSQGELHSVIKNTNIEAEKEVVGKYSLGFLENIVKEADPNVDITIEIRNEAPLKIAYPLGNTSIEFYLAHMIL